MRAASSPWLAVEHPETMFAITVSDVAVGGIGAKLRDDVERCSAEVGYWLGEPYWGRGIMSRALAAFTRFAFTAYDLERLYAVPYASNAASCRVLQKAGYRLEGRMRRSAIKDGKVQDQFLYAILARRIERQLKTPSVQQSVQRTGCARTSGGD